MSIPMTLEVTGAIPVDFENHQYIKVFADVPVKGGVGSVSQIFPYHNLKDWGKFSHIEAGKRYKANCTVSFEGKGNGDKKTEIVIETIEFIKSA